MALLLFLVFAFVSADCPNNCAPHGRCLNNVCSCFDPWTGSDCSIELRAITAGAQQQGFVGANGWQFYKYTNSEVNTFAVDLSPREETPGSDCDLYVRLGAIPSSLDYDARDVEWGSNAHVEIQNARVGTWYFGVFGSIFACAYDIKVTSAGGCPGGCGTGRCQKQSNGTSVCICPAGYVGTNCQYQTVQTPVVLNTMVTGDVNRGAWKYYQSNLAMSYSLLRLVVNITNSDPRGHDCDVYIRKNALPDNFHWDQKDESPNPNFSVNIPNASPGTLWIGFYGYEQCNFRFQLQNVGSSACSSQCSNHGVCLNGVCVCRTGYSGNVCETRTAPLVNGQMDSGHVDQNYWNWYTYQSDSTNNVLITVDEIGDGDCDVYVRHNTRPTRVSYDYLSVGNVKTNIITVTDALQDTLHIGVLGWEKCTYQITAVQTRACSPNCRGTCNQGRCVCPPGYSGVDCTEESTPLTSARVVRGQISTANEWSYFTFNGTQHTLLVALDEESPEAGKAFLGLYINQNAPPTNRDFVAGNIAEDRKYKFLALGRPAQAQPPFSWIVGVYGSPSMSSRVSRPIPFKLVVWEPEF